MARLGTILKIFRQTRTTAWFSCSVHSLQDAVDRAAEGGWIVVQEVCNEEVVIKEDRLRIPGVNDATIAPAAGALLSQSWQTMSKSMDSILLVGGERSRLVA
jgi:hypothetical protein